MTEITVQAGSRKRKKIRGRWGEEEGRRHKEEYTDSGNLGNREIESSTALKGKKEGG